MSDSYCSLVSSLATVFILLMCIVLRTGSIIEELNESEVQEDLWSFLKFDAQQTLFILFASSALVFAVVLYFMYRCSLPLACCPAPLHTFWS